MNFFDGIFMPFLFTLTKSKPYISWKTKLLRLFFARKKFFGCHGNVTVLGTGYFCIFCSFFKWTCQNYQSVQIVRPKIIFGVAGFAWEGAGWRLAIIIIYIISCHHLMYRTKMTQNHHWYPTLLRHLKNRPPRLHPGRPCSYISRCLQWQIMRLTQREKWKWQSTIFIREFFSRFIFCHSKHFKVFFSLHDLLDYAWAFVLSWVELVV